MISVRAVMPADNTAWLRMRSALWPDVPQVELAGEIAEYLAGKAHEPLAVLIACDDAGAAVGFVELSIRNVVDGCVTDRVAYLEAWYVEPDARRRGVGRTLVVAAEDWGRAQGCTEFGSDTQLWNVDSAAAHAALGFTEVEQLRCFKKML